MKKILITFMLVLIAIAGHATTFNWFKTDTVTIKGRIEGYDAELFGFTSMECYMEDIFEKSSTTLVLDIAPDGTFSKKFQASYPIQHLFIPGESKRDFFVKIPFFARPGETIDITVRKNERGQYECIYNSGSSRDVQRWLHHSDIFDDLAYPLHIFKGTIAEANQKAEEIWQNMMYQLQSMSRQNHFTPMETQLAFVDAQANFAYAWMNYIMSREDELVKYEKRDSVYHKVITDSVELKALHDKKNYKPLHNVDFDNPLLLSSQHYPTLLNRIQFSDFVRDRQFEDMIDENGFYDDNVENARKRLTNGLSALRDIMGTDKDNMMAQLCAYKEMLNKFNDWRNDGDTIQQFPIYLAAFTHPYIRQKAEQFYANKMAQTELSSPLPDVPMADLIRSLCDKYPGRFLMIDFWGMGCGPCRAAIQRSKEKRAEIAQRDDVKLIFIAGERTTEGSDDYKNYVKEWLADEETICVTNADFARLQELFQFNSIPHYETITPDGRRVRDDLLINGFYNFDYELQRLKEICGD